MNGYRFVFHIKPIPVTFKDIINYDEQCKATIYLYLNS